MAAFSQLFEDPIAAIGYGLLTSGQNPVGAAMGVMQQAEQNKAAREQAEFQKLMMQYKMEQAMHPKPKLVPNSATGLADQYQYDPVAGSYYPMPMGQGPQAGIQTRDIPPPSQYDIELGSPPPAGNIDDLVRRQLSAGGFAPRGGFNGGGSPNMAMPPQLPAQIPDTAMGGQPQMTPIPKPMVNNPKDARKLKDAEIANYGKATQPITPIEQAKLDASKKEEIAKRTDAARKEATQKLGELNTTARLLEDYNQKVLEVPEAAVGPVAGRITSAAGYAPVRNLESAQNALTLSLKAMLNMPSANFSDADRDFLTRITDAVTSGKPVGQDAAQRIERLLAIAAKSQQDVISYIEENGSIEGYAPAYIPPNLKTPTKGALPQNDPRIAKAKAAGYTDEEIQQYLGSRK